MNKGYGGNGVSGKKAFLAVVAVYLVCVILGCLIIWLIPFVKNRSDLLEIATDKGEEILSAGQKEEVMIFGMDYALYSASGFRLYRINNFLYASEWDQIAHCAEEVFQEGHIFSPAILLLDNRDDDPRHIFGVIVGTLVEGPGGRPFASILIRDFADLDTSMIIYIAIFTFLYAIGLVFMAQTLRKERELNRMRRDLIANVSHELKTPITAIRAMAEVLHDDMAKDPKSRRAYSGKIIEESDKLERLVLDILELSRLQSKREEFHKTKVHADGIIPPIVDHYMMLCGDLGITLDISGLNLEPVPVLFTDYDKMVSLMNILLDNAVKFTGEGGCIWLSNQIGPKSTTFCIRDNGPGIRSEDVNRIFDRFYKADTAHNSSGSGLGLAIADEIAKGLGEKLWVESKYGAGAAFYFTISY